jgi:hypothetical protein
MSREPARKTASPGPRPWRGPRCWPAPEKIALPWAAFHCAFTVLCPEARTGIAAHLSKVRLAG